MFGRKVRAPAKKAPSLLAWTTGRILGPCAEVDFKLASDET